MVWGNFTQALAAPEHERLPAHPVLFTQWLFPATLPYLLAPPIVG